MKRHSRTLGFLPLRALRDYLDKGDVLGAKTNDNKLVGYLLYATHSDRFRIAQLCVSEKSRKKRIAKQLMDKLKGSVTTQKTIVLRCRRDFPAYKIWPKLGFVPESEKPGRSAAGHLLTLWKFTLAHETQDDLFQAKISDSTLDVVIDANVFFDFYKSDDDKTQLSKALCSDFLVDDIELWITDELFVEIDRNNDADQRNASRKEASIFQKVKCNYRQEQYFVTELKNFLPSNSSREKSDINQLAKTAASGINIFVTRDKKLLNKAAKISELTNIRVLSPTELIIQLHELTDKPSYYPTPVSGLTVNWHRVTSKNSISGLFDSFHNEGENKVRFKEQLEPFLVDPDRYKCELLQSGTNPVAIRVLENEIDNALTIHFVRVARSTNDNIFARFSVSDTLHKAVRENIDVVQFKKSSIPHSLIPYLLEIGFIEYKEDFVRFCFSRYLNHKEALSAITALHQHIENYHNLSLIDLERICSPLALKQEEQKYFLIPIRPGYAISLVDTHQSAGDLIGGNPNILLRWDNVYYRSKTHHKIINIPARILWYVSGVRQQHIVATSHLDEVIINTPAVLFKKFKKFGVLEWKEIYKMCDHDSSKEIMALRFSHTFSFRQPVSLNAIKQVIKKNITLQGPLRIQMEEFRELFQLGYPN